MQKVLNFFRELNKPCNNPPDFSTDTFEIQTVLGAGAYGSAYKVMHKHDGGHYALKLADIQRLEKQGDDMAKMQEAAAREVRVLRELRHDNVLRYFFSFVIWEIPKSWKQNNDFKFPSVSPFLCIQTELCHTTLGELLTSRPLNADIMSLMRQMAAGIEYCHSKNVMHRDLSSKNIFLNRLNSPNGPRQYTLIIGDFGLSRFYNPNEVTTNLNTCVYSSMEMKDADTTYTNKCDVYGMAVLFLEILFQDPSFNAFEEMMTGLKQAILNRQERLEQGILDGQEINVREFNLLAQYPALYQLIFRMLLKEADRPTSLEVKTEINQLEF